MLVSLMVMARGQVFAGGLWLYEGSIPDMGMANAGRAASALDASTASGNPAAMTVLERSQLVTGFMGIQLNSRFHVDHSTYGGGGGGNAGYFTPNGTFAYVYRLNDRLRLGIAMGSNFGLGMKYGDHWSGRYYVQDGDIMTATINPSLAWKINDYLSVGGGVSAVGGKMSTKVGVNALLPRRGDGSLKFEDTDLGYNYNLGILFELSKKTRFGLTYRSQVDFTYKDKPELKREGWLLDSVLNLKKQSKRTLSIGTNIPQAIMFSGWHQLTPKFAICGNLGWQDWSKFGTPEISVSGNKSHSFTADLHYYDTYHVAFGGQYRLAPKWLMSAGASYDTSLLKHASDRSPSAPLDRAIRYATGLQYDVNNDITIGGALELIDAGTCRVDKKGGPLRGDLKGENDTNSLTVFNLNVVWKF